MYRARQVLPVLLLLVFVQRAAVGQQPINWEGTIDSAKATARQSNRLVLVFFSASWCQACHRLENDLRNQPGAVSAIEAKFVPVKISYDFYPNTARRYGVTRLPTTVILAPNAKGDVLGVIPEAMAVNLYLSKLDRVFAEAKARNAGAFASIQASPPVGSPASPSPESSLSIAVRPSATAAASASIVQPANRYRPPYGMASASLMPAAATGSALSGGQPREPQRPMEVDTPRPTPSLGLDGYCPVVLVEKGRWQKGKKEWGAIHRGKIYLFAGSDERRRFLANPDRYAPVNSCNDVVFTLEHGRTVPGLREHGVQYDGHVYLFADESTLAKFHSNPRYYAERALQAIRPASQTAAMR